MLPAPVKALKKATNHTSGEDKQDRDCVASRLPASARPTSPGMVSGRVMPKSSRSTRVKGYGALRCLSGTGAGNSVWNRVVVETSRPVSAGRHLALCVSVSVRKGKPGDSLRDALATPRTRTGMGGAGHSKALVSEELMTMRMVLLLHEAHEKDLVSRSLLMIFPGCSALRRIFFQT